MESESPCTVSDALNTAWVGWAKEDLAVSYYWGLVALHTAESFGLYLTDSEAVFVSVATSNPPEATV